MQTCLAGHVSSCHVLSVSKGPAWRQTYTFEPTTRISTHCATPRVNMVAVRWVKTDDDDDDEREEKVTAAAEHDSSILQGNLN